MYKQNLAAFTTEGCNYPSYVSINLVDDQVEIIVRSEIKDNGNCGETASMKMSQDEFQKLKHDLLVGEIPTVPFVEKRLAMDSR